MKVPSFSDESLNRAARNTAKKIIDYKDSLNATSRDINTLEKWLQDNQITVPAAVQIDNSGDFIRWKKFDKQWRIVYCGSEFLDHAIINFEKPLIEAPVKARLIAKPYLADLVNELAEFIPEFAQEEECLESLEDDEQIFASEDEIPF